MGNYFTIRPGLLRGVQRVPSAKSELLRAVMLGSVARGATVLSGESLCADARAALAAVARCGVKVETGDDGTVEIHGGRWLRAGPLSAGESAFLMRTLPFLAGFQGLVGSIAGEGTLLGRPQHTLYATLRSVGMLYEETSDGRLQFGYLLPKEPYEFELPYLNTSQPLSGLLMAAPLVGKTVRVRTVGMKSGGYVEMTLAMMGHFGVEVQRPEAGVYVVPQGQRYRARGVAVGGDWSAASVFIAAAAHGGKIVLTNLAGNSLQPDCALLHVLKQAGVKYSWGSGGALQVDGTHERPKSFTFDATNCPDLAPALVLLASKAEGLSHIGGVGRLRGKESDRASALVEGFNSIGGRVRIAGDELVVDGVDSLRGGAAVSARGDHRMAMVFGAAGALSERGVRVEGSDSVNKSYVNFWTDLETLQQAN